MEIIDVATWGSDNPNEDCAGHAGNLAWVIDGATDLVDAPIVGEVSDAAWLAETAHRELIDLATEPPTALGELPPLLNQRLRSAFIQSARKQPEHAWENPSAAALIVRSKKNRLDWVALGDCALIVRTGTSLTTTGVGGDDAGDRRTAAEVARLQQKHGIGSEAERRAQIWPKLREGRGAALNQPGGSAVLSITPPPSDLIEHGTIEVPSGSHALLATDGLIRLIDIYGKYTSHTLLEAAIANGIEFLLAELRKIEEDDAECVQHPRVKSSDDATGLLLRWP